MNIYFDIVAELSKLSLRKLDFSNNRISVIPTAFRKIETLEEILLDSNPLTMPPAHVSTIKFSEKNVRNSFILCISYYLPFF